MKRFRWTIIILTLVLAIAACGAGALITLHRIDASDAAAETAEAETEEHGDAVISAVQEPAAASETPSFVSLYTVSEINSRARSLTAVTSEAVSTSGEMQSVMDAHPELTYVSTQLDDLPLLEVYKDTGETRPLLLFLHGLGNDKESVIGALCAFAEAGYHAVGVDAFNQGERYSPQTNSDTWASMLITVGDIDPIVEYFQTVADVDAERFVLGGFSMGAVESMAYVETGARKPAAVIALCGACDFSAWQPWQQETLAYGWLRDWKDSVWTFPEWQEFWYTDDKYDSIFSLDATYNLTSFTDVPVLFCIGTADRFFSAWGVQYVADQLGNTENANVECIVYPGGRHEITDAMLEDSLQFLSNISI